MALDGIYLYSLICELKSTIIGCKVDKINQPEKDEIIISLRGDKFNTKLLISASSIYPKMHLTDNSKPNPIKAPMFCMVLRKYLNSSKIVDIEQLSTDRVAIIDFSGFDELGYEKIYSLMIEIMGRHSNITLLRKDDKQILDSIKHVSLDMNSYRCLYPGIQFIYPPASTKLDPFTCTFDEFKQYISDKNIKFNDKTFSSVFTGISTLVSKELLYRLKKADIEPDTENMLIVYNFIMECFQELKEHKFNFASYLQQDSKAFKEFSCIELSHLNNLIQKEYSSPSKLLEEFYFEKDKADRLKSKSADLQKIINTNLDRCEKKHQILTGTLEECTEKDSFRLYGELLTANIFNIKKGDSIINLLNYYNNTNIDIKLDPNKTPSENIQYYYKKYNKLKKSEEMAAIQLKLTNEEIEYLQSVVTSIMNAENYDEIEEIRRELIETGYIRFKKNNKNKKAKLSKPLHFVSSDGLDIFVGKNNYQNDYLTLKFAEKHDTWLHAKNIPGSHVIIKKYGQIPEKTLMEAANLAAYYSKGKDSSKVPIDYTEVKNVKKPSGAKPGMVIYYTNKTIYITPEKPAISKL